MVFAHKAQHWGVATQGRDETDVEQTLMSIMIVFKYIEDKDVFQKYYSKFLAKRLIMELSASDQMEAEMISQLKTACGTEYTSKLQRMIQVIVFRQAVRGWVSMCYRWLFLEKFCSHNIYIDICLGEEYRYSSAGFGYILQRPIMLHS